MSKCLPKKIVSLLYFICIMTKKKKNELRKVQYEYFEIAYISLQADECTPKRL